MQFILLFGIGMAALAGGFWIYELMPFAKAAKRLKPNTNGKPLHDIYAILIYIISIIQCSILLTPFIIDIGITWAMTSIFSFGGTTGGIIGLFMSNIFSVFIIIIKNTTSEEVTA